MEIEYTYETEFEKIEETKYSDWIYRIISSEGYNLETLTFVFCDDDYLLEINRKYLQHDTLTDIITFDYTDGERISGDVCISIERVRENSGLYGVDENEELRRVMAHGVLHLMGYKDKTHVERQIMRRKEDEKLKLFHVEH